MKLNKKTIITLLSVVLVVALAIGGTIAWLQDSKEATASFTGSDSVTVTLTDAEISSQKVIPGQKVDYNPKVTVNASVKAFVFVQITDTDSLLGTLSMVEGWTELTGDGIPSGVYYRSVTGNESGQDFYVFSGGKITIDSKLTNTTLSEISSKSVSLRAAAIQKAWINGSETGTTAAEAWAALNHTP